MSWLFGFAGCGGFRFGVVAVPVQLPLLKLCPSCCVVGFPPIPSAPSRLDLSLDLLSLRFAVYLAFFPACLVGPGCFVTACRCFPSFPTGFSFFSKRCGASVVRSCFLAFYRMFSIPSLPRLIAWRCLPFLHPAFAHVAPS